MLLWEPDEELFCFPSRVSSGGKGGEPGCGGCGLCCGDFGEKRGSRGRFPRFSLQETVVGLVAHGLSARVGVRGVPQCRGLQRREAGTWSVWPVWSTAPASCSA